MDLESHLQWEGKAVLLYMEIKYIEGLRKKFC